MNNIIVNFCEFKFAFQNSFPLLILSCTNAFDVKHHPKKSETHIFLVLVELTAKVENGEQRPMKMSRVGDAKLVPKFEMATILPELYDTITAAPDEQKKGTVSQEYNGIMFEVVRCRDHCTTMRYP